MSAGGAQNSFEFVILGDRTGEAQPGVYEQVWKEAAAEHPAFVLSVGDTIQGLDDATAAGEWKQVSRVFQQRGAIPLYLAPGNHDVWSAKSEALFRKFAGHPPHYSFDFGGLHVTVLDNSRTENFSADELHFLEHDLEAHKQAEAKLVISHRPSWLLPVLFANSHSPFHQIARKYGVRYVIAGHIHQMLRFELDGITYLSMPSAGGHLRASKRYEDGWFFGHTLVEDTGGVLRFQVEEVRSPFGKGRLTQAQDWGVAGLAR
ncbi:MAG TPA: metallophosphoesterase [Bryobacteraceae bacterium]